MTEGARYAIIIDGTVYRDTREAAFETVTIRDLQTGEEAVIAHENAPAQGPGLG